MLSLAQAPRWHGSGSVEQLESASGSPSRWTIGLSCTNVQSGSVQGAYQGSVGEILDKLYYFR